MPQMDPLTDEKMADGFLQGVFGTADGFVNSTTWYAIRLASFVTINVLVGLGIYKLFKRAGVVGGGSNTQEAELIEG